MYDASNVNATSTSVSLLFNERPVLNFATYVARMEKALRGSFQDTMQLTWDHDDVVTIDIDGSRVLLGYWETPEQLTAEGETCAAVMVLAVGPGPDWRAETRLARFRKSLCQSVVAGIVESHPADLILWKDFQGVFTPEDFDMLIDQALETSRDSSDLEATPAGMADPEAGPEVLTPERHPETEKGERRFGALPVRRLMDRLETEIPTTEPMRLPQMPVPFAESADTPVSADGPSKMELDARADFQALIANDMPDLPAPDFDQLDRIRDALYPQAEDEDKPELVQRLTIYAANTTLMLVALPVGAALLTYNILGGEDAKITARAMALTGAALGMMHTGFGHALMQLMT